MPTPRSTRPPELRAVRTARLAAVCALALAIATAAEPARSEDLSPTATIENFHTTLLTAMKGSATLDYRGRREILQPVVDATLDLPFMAEKAAGRFWKQFPETDQARWVAAFRDNTIANYAGRFNRFSGQSFVTHGEEPAAFETTLVKTTLKDPGGEDVQLNYRMKRNARGWQVIDIFMHGTVSELALRRAEYSSAFERDGLEKVIQNLAAQVAKLESDSSSAAAH